MCQAQKSALLELHASSEFVTRTVAHFRGMGRQTRKRLPHEVAKLSAAVQDVQEAPNLALIMWVTACFGGKEQSTLDASLQAVIDKDEEGGGSRGCSVCAHCCSPRRPCVRTVSRVLYMPFLQLMLMMIVCVYMVSEAGSFVLTTKAKLPAGDNGAYIRAMLWHMLEVSVAMLLYSISVAQTVLLFRAWLASCITPYLP